MISHVQKARFEAAVELMVHCFVLRQAGAWSRIASLRRGEGLLPSGVAGAADMIESCDTFQESARKDCR